MTRISLRILALAAIASLPLLAQQPPPNPQPQPDSSPQAAPVPSTATSPEAASPHLRPVTGELVDKLDTKSAKAGDSVVVKTTETATTENGIEIPKGSKIVGHIIDVAPKGQGGDNSRVTIQFDQAEVKGGQSMPIRSVIQSVAPPGTAAAADAASGPPAATPSGGSEATGSGAGMSKPGAPGTSSNPSTGSAQATPGTSPSQPSPSGQAEAGSPPAPGTVIATKGNIAIRTTSIPGVLLVGSVSGQPFSNAAGALLGAKQDVHLEGGTVMVVAIATAPPAVSGR